MLYFNLGRGICKSYRRYSNKQIEFWPGLCWFGKDNDPCRFPGHRWGANATSDDFHVTLERIQHLYYATIIQFTYQSSSLPPTRGFRVITWLWTVKIADRSKWIHATYIDIKTHRTNKSHHFSFESIINIKTNYWNIKDEKQFSAELRHAVERILNEILRKIDCSTIVQLQQVLYM